MVKLTPSIYKIIALPQYSDIAEKIFSEIYKVPHIIFVYESLLNDNTFSELNENSSLKDFDEDELYDNSYFKVPTKDCLNKVNNSLKSLNLNLIPYKKNSEITVIANTFLDDLENNLIFKIYIPSDKIYSNEIEKILQLFNDYLVKVKHLNSHLKQRRTSQGVIYELCGKELLDTSNLSDNFDEFLNFMHKCKFDTAEIKNKFAGIDMINIIDKYSKEYSRLCLDLKQERERKILSIQHRLESELTDNNISCSDINIIINNMLPNLNILTHKNLITHNNQEIIQVKNNPVINNIEDIISKEIYGDNIDSEAKQILLLINTHCKDRAIELTSALYELIDKNITKSEKLPAKQQIKFFLLNCRSKITDISLHIFVKYLESLIK